jgi:hypothetical protein
MPNAGIEIGLRIAVVPRTRRAIQQISQLWQTQHIGEHASWPDGMASPSQRVREVSWFEDLKG